MRHMKTIVLALMLGLVLACPASAETLHIGGTSIEYAVPAGYVPLEYEDMRVTANALELHAMYVPKGSDQRITDFGINISRSLLVFHQKPFETAQFTAANFETYKKELKKQIAAEAALPLADGNATELREAIRQAYQEFERDPADGSSNVRLIGTYGETPTRISYLGLSKNELRLGEKAEADMQALVMTFLLCKGKLAQIAQYRSARNADDVLALRDEALAVLESMRFVEGPAGGTQAGVKPQE